jgi:hypothetical protein
MSPNLKRFSFSRRLQVNAQGRDFQNGGFQVHQPLLESGWALVVAAWYLHNGTPRNRQVAVKPFYSNEG